MTKGTVYAGIFAKMCRSLHGGSTELVTAGCLDWEEDIPLEEQGNAADANGKEGC